MPDISKRLEKAEKYLQRGRQDSALEEYLGALAEEPGNDTVRQTAADLSLTMGRNREAAALLAELFDKQAAINDISRAAANYKKLTRVASPAVEQTFRYAQLIEKSSRRESVEAYHAAAQGFIASGRKPDALAALKRMVALDPSKDNLRREGELASQLGDHKSAGAAFLSVGQLEEEAGAPGLPWYERAHKHDPQNSDIALAYGKALIAAGQPKNAIQVLAPTAGVEGARIEDREAYAKALLAAKQLPEAEPFIWELFERDPRQVGEVGALIAALLEAGHYRHALELANRLQLHQVKQGKQREFVALMKEITEKHQAGLEVLEYLAEMYNSANREHEYCATLLKLFEMYCASGNFPKAADCLDRAADVDSYEPGHNRRLEMLRGKIDGSQFNAIASRLASIMKPVEEAQPKPEAPESESAASESTVLEDLMLQAEIFLQYSMRNKAVERLERIQKLFPREEEHNEKLRLLFTNAGLIPQYADGPATPPAAAATPPGAPAAPAAAPPPSARVPMAAAGESAVENFARVTEITRNIYRQGSVKGVLFTAVNEIGRHFNASRCVAGLCTPGKPPSAALEYCATGVKPSQVVALIKLITTTQLLAQTRGAVSLVSVPGAPELKGIREFVQELAIESMLAVPLMDGEEHAGILILQQCGTQRSWRPTDEVVLKTIAEQTVLAVNNARLRSLVKTLAVTDEKSGLLKRSSYLDVLLSEVKRALQQNSTCSVMLMHFGKASSLVKEFGESAVESVMQQTGQIINSHIRQNDVAVRYELTSIALLLADTGEKNAFFVVDKLRKALGGVRLPGKSTPLPITVGIAEAVMQSRFDPVDIVTEAINRVEAALEAAKAQGPNSVKSLAAALEGAAVTA